MYNVAESGESMKKKGYRIVSALPLPAAILLRCLAERFPQSTERFFSAGFYPAIAAPLSRVIGRIPFSITLPMLLLILAGITFLLAKKRFWICAAAILTMAALFWGGWGLNYARLPVEESLELDMRQSSAQELESLCMDLTREADEAWRDIQNIPEKEEIFEKTAELFEAAHQVWEIIPGGEWGNPKAAWGASALTRLNIEGITIPLTLEALVNDEIPGLFLPFVACHEAAHLRGFAREEDANFWAYLVLLQSQDGYFRASGAVNAYIYAYNALKKTDRAAAQRVRQERPEWLEEQLALHAAFWRPYQETKTAAVSAAVNEQYLQTAGVEQSRASYGRMVDLLLAYGRMEENER